MRIVGGARPDLTPAQLVSAVPVGVALAATIVRPPEREQSRVLGQAVAWSSALVLADAFLRVGRGLAARPAPTPRPAEPTPLDREAIAAALELESEDLAALPPSHDDGEDLRDREFVDVELTKTGEVHDEAGKPAGFR